MRSSLYGQYSALSRAHIPLVVVLKTGVTAEWSFHHVQASDARAGRGCCGGRGRLGGPLPFAQPPAFSCRDPILTHLVLPVSREIPCLWTAPALEDLPISLGRAQARQSWGQ